MRLISRLKRVPYAASLGDHIFDEEGTIADLGYRDQEKAALMRQLLDDAILNHNAGTPDPDKCTGCGVDLDDEEELCGACRDERNAEEAHEFRRGDD